MTDERKAKRRAAARAWYAANRERCLAAARVWRAANPEKVKDGKRKEYLLHKEKYNAYSAARYQARRANPTTRAVDLTKARERYERDRSTYLDGSRVAYISKVRRLERIAGRPAPALCEICGEPSKRRLDFDHDHYTGEFRGWICWRCNAVLGKVKDDTDLLDKLIVYLARARRPKLLKRST
jgi:hypothetical protein